MAERLNALVLKTSKGLSPSRVQIPIPPPLFLSSCAQHTSPSKHRDVVAIRLIKITLMIFVALYFDTTSRKFNNRLAYYACAQWQTV